MTIKEKTPPAPNQFVEICKEVLEENKAFNILTIDVKSKSTLFSYIIIATGTSGRHLITLRDKLYSQAKNLGIKNIMSEGDNTLNWIIIDLGDVLIHLFREEVRDYYKIEEIWN